MPSPAFTVLQRAIWIMLAAVALITVPDPDLWGHIRFGLDILRERHLPTIDPYSFTQDKPWVNHEWLSEVAMGLAYQLGGSIGLVALKVALVGTAIVMIARSLPAQPLLLREALLALVVWGALPLIKTIRPQLWTFLGIVVLLRLLHTRRLWWVPLLLAIWANAHGGYIVGLGVVWLWTLAARLDEESTPLTLPIVSTLATLITPYGVGLWRFLWETVRLTRPDIQEWQPLWTAPPVVWVPWVLAVVLVGRSRTWRAWLIAGGLAVASVKVMRLVPLFIVVATLGWAWSAAQRSAVPQALSRAEQIVNALATCVLALATLWVVTPQARCLSTPEPWMPSVAQMTSLRGRTGRLAVEFAWGEYAIWHLGPQMRVSFDGRRETIYSDQTIMIQNALAHGEEVGLRWLREQQPEYLWFNGSRYQLKTALPEIGYRIDLADVEGFVAARKDQPVLTAGTPRTPCFPD